jgi:hypothetical protein
LIATVAGVEDKVSGQVGHGPAPPVAAQDAGIIAALRVDPGLHDDPGRLKLPDVGTGQERVSLGGDLLSVPGQQAND